MLLPEMGVNDFPDIMAMVDEACDISWVDAERIGVLGGSYGGFLTNWVVSHSDRFKAAVTQRTVADWYSAWGTDDIFFADEDVDARSHTLGRPGPLLQDFRPSATSTTYTRRCSSSTPSKTTVAQSRRVNSSTLP